MVEGDVAGTIEQHQGWCGAGAVQIEILFADWNGNALQSRIEVLPHPFDVGQFILWSSVFSLRTIAVELRWGQQHQSTSTEFGVQTRDNWTFSFAIATPVRPEKKQDRRTVELCKGCRLGTQVLRNTQRRRRLSCEPQQIKVLSQTRLNGSIPVSQEAAAEKSDGLRLIPAGKQYL